MIFNKCLKLSNFEKKYVYQVQVQSSTAFEEMHDHWWGRNSDSNIGKCNFMRAMAKKGLDCN